MKNLTFIVIILPIAQLLSCCQTDSTEDLKVQDIWNAEFIGKPMGNVAINSIQIHPKDDSLWFITSWNGIYISRDGGYSWENHLSDFSPALEINPKKPSNILVGSWTDLYYSEDYGHSWILLKKFERTIQSLLIREIDQSYLVGLRWEDSEKANGIYKSENGGDSWVHYSYEVTSSGLIPWDIEEDPINNKIYIATEIWDHPEPYSPPFLRSSDGGEHWEDISEGLPWHGLKIQVHPETSDIYFLTEGMGLYYSTNFGDDWEKLSNYFWLEFIIDKNNPERFFGGNHTANTSSGGVYFSKDQGKTFKLIALQEEIVNSLCLDEESVNLYVASYGSGIYRIRPN